MIAVRERLEQLSLPVRLYVFQRQTARGMARANLRDQVTINLHLEHFSCPVTAIVAAPFRIQMSHREIHHETASESKK